LCAQSLENRADLLMAFRQGLNETGYFEGRNVTIEYRAADDHAERLPTLAAELADHHVAAIMAAGGNVAALAARAATTTIPIVFTLGGDPVQLRLVASLNRPGGNVTGVTLLAGLLGAKRLELIRQLVPNATTVGILTNPTNPASDVYVKDAQEAARALGVQPFVLNASTADEIVSVFATVAERKLDALLVITDTLFIGRREQIVAQAAGLAIPAIYESRDFVVRGGLMSYGPSYTEANRQAGIYTGRILKGANPADLPVMQPTKFELVLNRKTAKELNLTLPPQLLAVAEEVIE
jgi:putative ABC transport system substrate-binding protein